MFTDEPRFCVDVTDRRVRIWRSSNKRFASVCVTNPDRSVWDSVNMWAGIRMKGKTDAYVVQNGRATAARYVNEILDVCVLPYAGVAGPDFILMDDNACPLRARATNEYLLTATIERMNKPARSQNRNPIEHAWDILHTTLLV